MRWRTAEGAHLVQHHSMATLGQLPRGFATGEAAARNVHRGTVVASISAQLARHAGMIARRRAAVSATTPPRDALRRLSRRELSSLP